MVRQDLARHGVASDGVASDGRGLRGWIHRVGITSPFAAAFANHKADLLARGLELRPLEAESPALAAVGQGLTASRKLSLH